MKLLRIPAFLGYTARVKASGVQRNVPLTGEFLPYQSVSIFARVNGYVEHVEVDRGTSVRQGQLLAEAELKIL